MKTLIIFLLMTGIAMADEIDALISAIIQVESNGDRLAVSPAGCIGLMQINPRGALAEWNMQHPKEQYSKEDLFLPGINIMIAKWYLRRLKDHYLRGKYTVARMLAGYNGGITKLRRKNYSVAKMPKESRDYVRKVLIAKKINKKKK